MQRLVKGRGSTLTRVIGCVLLATLPVAVLPGCGPRRSYLNPGLRRRIREELKSNPNSPVVHYNAALMLADRKKYPEAEEELREAIELDPSFAAAHYALGCHLALVHPEKAEDEFGIARKLNPLVDQNVAMLFISEFDRVKAVYDEVEACGEYDRPQADSLEIHDFLTQEGYADFRLSRSVSDFQGLKEVYDVCGVPEVFGGYDGAYVSRSQAYKFWTEMGYIYFLLDRHDEALRSLAMATSRCVHGLSARYYRASILVRQGNLAEAIKELEFMLAYWKRMRRLYLWEWSESKEGYAVAASELAYFYNLDGRREKAVQTYLTALDANPEDAFIHYAVATLYGEADDIHSMRDHLLMADSLNPDNHHFKCELATAYLALGEHEKAICLYDSVLAKHPRYAKAIYNLARAHELAGDSVTSVAHYQRFCEMAPRELRKYREMAEQKVEELRPKDR